MASRQLSFHAELTQQVWGATKPVTVDREFKGQLTPGIGPQKAVPYCDDDELAETESIDGSSDDEDFGEFETPNSSSDDETWVSIDYNKFEDMTSGVADLAAYANRPALKNLEDSEYAMSPPPSPLPRGYLRSTQNVDAYLHPMDSGGTNELGDLLSFESSSYGDYTPLVNADTGSVSSAQARHGTPAERIWILGKTAFTRLASARQGAGKQAKQAVAAWKTSFVDKEHDDLARVAREAKMIPMVKLQPASARDLRPDFVSGAMANDDGAKDSHVGYMAESWMDAEKRAWDA
ncbi:hypothetical protein SLS60_005889 [Paraconiothyrium brasiliense]|uniref:Uncharacterized protein n=1 Tax=Paraconiothyrium brasiliense TaxID=300254 RepID=A0ABR3RE12_9PLEO